MNPKFNRFILIENICLVLIMLVLVVIPAINKNTSTHSDVVVKELTLENERLKAELVKVNKELFELNSDIIALSATSGELIDVSLDCSTAPDIKVIQDIKNNYPELLDVVYREAVNHGIDRYYLIAIILTETGFQKGENGFLGLFDVHNAILLLEDVLTQEIHNFITMSGIKKEDQLLAEDTRETIYRKSFSYEKSYVKVFGRDKLNKLYNNYKLVSGKPFSSLK